jgi:membrane associated rhomboid family serine protease
MLRQTRWSIRISFLLVIVFAAFGLWYATTFWQPAIDFGDWSAYSGGIDWVETISGWGETAIQLLLGATSTQ